MKTLRLIWERFEEGFIAFLLAAMTLITCFYVLLNNLYTMFFSFGDSLESKSEWLSELMFTIGDYVLDMAQAMTWSNALTKALFAWLIFSGLAYGVRIGGHIAVDVVVQRFSTNTQRYLAMVACLCCLAFAGLLTVASYDWVSALKQVNIGAEDLGQYGVKQWYINSIVPIGFALVFIRFSEIFVRLVLNKQSGLGVVSEVDEALKLQSKEEGQTP